MESGQEFMTLRRQVYTRKGLDDVYPPINGAPSLADQIKSGCYCDRNRFVNTLIGYVPVISVLKNYKPSQDLLRDFISGLSVAFMHMPQGLALGLLASVPPIYGLYGTFFPILIYLIFGTSRHVSMGTNALISLLTAIVVDQQLESHIDQLMKNGTSTSFSDSEVQAELPIDEQNSYKVGVATAVAFISGAVLLGMGLLKLGFVTSYMASSFIGGFTTAAAVHICTSQIPKMLHIKTPGRSGPGRIIQSYVDIFENIHKSNPGDVIVSILSIIFLLVVTICINERFKNKLKIPIPVDLLIVIISTLISHFADLHTRYGINVVGQVETGLLAPTMPNTEVFSTIALDSIIIAILIFAMSISMAKLMAKLHDYELDDNQELVAYGLCNFLGSFFGSIPNCLAPPRTMILNNLGAKSTLNGIFSAVFILIVLLVAGSLFESLPVAVLAAMICVAVKNLLLQVRNLPRIWRVSKPDFIIWTVTCLVGVFVNLDISIGVGIVVSIFTVVIYSQLVAGVSGGVSGKEDLLLPDTNRSDAIEEPGVKIFHFPSPLHFANAERFRKELYSKILDPNTSDVEIPVRNDINNPVSNNETKESSGFNGNSENKFTISSIDNEISQNKYSNGPSVECHNQGKDVENQKVHRIKYIVIDCSAFSYIDMAGVDVLKTVITKYAHSGVTVFLASCPKYSRSLLKRANFFDSNSENILFYELWDAISYIRSTQNNQRNISDITKL